MIERKATVLETDDDIRQALLSGVKAKQQPVPVEPKAPLPQTKISERPASRPSLLVVPSRAS